MTDKASSKVSSSENFSFLARLDPVLDELASRAEELLYTDAAMSLVRTRMFGEHLARTLVDRWNCTVKENATYDELLNALKANARLDRLVLDRFYNLKSRGNAAAHENLGTQHAALSSLRTAHSLAIWFVRISTNPEFRTGPYVTPEALEQRRAQQQQEIERLRAEREALAKREAKARAERAAALEESAAALQLAEELEAVLNASPRGTALGPSQDEELERFLRYDRPSVWAEQENHAERFVGRAEQIRSLWDWLDNPSDSATKVVVARPGYGKSALLARFANLAARGANEDGTLRVGRTTRVLFHMPRGERDPRRVLQFLLWQAMNLRGVEVSPSLLEGSLLDLRERVGGALKSLAEEANVLLVIDGLDEVVSDLDAPARNLQFLLDQVPAGVRVLLSTRPVVPILGFLRRVYPSMSEVELKPLTHVEIEALVSKTADPSVAAWLVERIGIHELSEATEGVPIRLRHALLRAPTAFAQRGRTQTTDASWLRQSIEDVYREQLEEIRQPANLSAGKGRKARETLANLLSLARDPLSPSELASAMTAVGVRQSTTQCRARLDEISSFVISTGGELFRMYHHGLAEYVRDRLGPDDRATLYAALAGATPTVPVTNADRVISFVRYQSLRYREGRDAGMTQHVRDAADAVAGALCAYSVHETAARDGFLHDVAVLLDETLELMLSALPEPAAEAMSEWRSFQNRHMATLSRWPGLFYQLAVDSELTSVAVSAASQEAPAQPYFRREWQLPRKRSEPFDRSVFRSLPRGAAPSMVYGPLAASYDGSAVAASNDDGNQMRVWDVRSGALLGTVGERFLVTDALALGLGGARIWVGSRWMLTDESNHDAGCEGYPICFDVETGQQLWHAERAAVQGWIRAMEVLHGQGTLVTAHGEDEWCEGRDSGAVALWSAETGDLLASHELSFALSSLAVSPDGQLIVVGGCGGENGSTGSLRAYEAERLQPVWKVEPDEPVLDVECLQNGQLCVLTNTGTAHIYSPEGERLRSQTLPLPAPTRVLLGPTSSSVLFAAGPDYESNRVRVCRWDPVIGSVSMMPTVPGRFLPVPASGHMLVLMEGDAYLFPDDRWTESVVEGEPDRPVEPHPTAGLSVVSVDQTLTSAICIEGESTLLVNLDEYGNLGDHRSAVPFDVEDGELTLGSGASFVLHRNSVGDALETLVFWDARGGRAAWDVRVMPETVYELIASSPNGRLAAWLVAAKEEDEEDENRDVFREAILDSCVRAGLDSDVVDALRNGIASRHDRSAASQALSPETETASVPRSRLLEILGESNPDEIVVFDLMEDAVRGRYPAADDDLVRWEVGQESIPPWIVRVSAGEIAATEAQTGRKVVLAVRDEEAYGSHISDLVFTLLWSSADPEERARELKDVDFERVFNVEYAVVHPDTGVVWANFETRGVAYIRRWTPQPGIEFDELPWLPGHFFKNSNRPTTLDGRFLIAVHGRELELRPIGDPNPAAVWIAESTIVQVRVAHTGALRILHRSGTVEQIHLVEPS